MQRYTLMPEHQVSEAMEPDDNGELIRFEDVKHFILAEREACAKVCDNMPVYVTSYNATEESSASECAKAIRKRT